jgi:tetratricopeptide (TPR) repeat protein
MVQEVKLPAKSAQSADPDILCSGVSVPIRSKVQEPEKAVDLNRRGIAEARSENFSEASDLFRRAYFADTMNTTILLNLAQAQEQMRDTDEAARTYCTYWKKRFPDDGPSNLKVTIQRLAQQPGGIPSTEVENFNLGLVYAQRSQFPEAKRKFDQVIEIAPMWAEAYYNRGLVREALLDYDGAERDYNEYLRLSPTADDRQAVGRKLSRLAVAESTGSVSWNKVWLYGVLTPVGVITMLAAAQSS